jgi:hypothetical protein
MAGVITDIIAGLITAIISGGTVWLWQRRKRTRRIRRRANFFGVKPGQSALVVMNRHWQTEHAIARSDVYALLDAGSLVDELGGKIEVRSSDELREGVGDRTELCIGGPDSNPRTAAHIASFLPGIVVHSYSETGPAVAVTAGSDRFIRDPWKREFAILAKVVPSGKTHPVFVISGQTPITNQAAVHFLRKNGAHLARTMGARAPFCLIIRVTSPDVYGHELVDLEKDVTAIAFGTAAALPPSDAAGAPHISPGTASVPDTPET